MDVPSSSSCPSHQQEIYTWCVSKKAKRKKKGRKWRREKEEERKKPQHDKKEVKRTDARKGVYF